MAKRKKEVKVVKKGKFWLVLMISLAAFGLVFLIGSFMLGGMVSLDNIAIIEIKGVIMGDKSGGLIGTPSISSKEIVELIEKADENLFIKAIILEINSPGGSAVASAEIADAVKNANKPVISVIREMGASGGYWIASATDKIFAHKLSMTGSIGVIASYLEYAGLLDKYNVTYRRLVSGKYKDTGSPWKEMTYDEEVLFQSKLNKLYDAFIQEVADNRKLDKKKVQSLATGFIFLGTEAKENGLIDEFGGMKEAEEYLEKELGIKAKPVTYKKKKTLTDVLVGAMSNQLYQVGAGIGEGLFNSAKSNSYLQPAMT